MKHNRKIIVLWSVIVVLAAAVVVLSILLIKGGKAADKEPRVTQETEKKQENEQDTTAEQAESKTSGKTTEEASAQEKPDIYAVIDVENTWENGDKMSATETVTIYNNSGNALTDWSMDLVFPDNPVIEQLWNGKYSIEETVVHITPESYNEEIAAGETVSFGYNLTAADVEPEQYTIFVNGKEAASGTVGDTVAGTTEEASAGTEIASGGAETASTATEAASGGAEQAESHPFKEHGKLSVSGVSIVDEHGNPYQLKGVSTHGLTWFQQYVNKETYQYFKDSFGINLIRFAMYTDTGDSYGYCSGGNKEEIEQLLQTGVDAATDLDLYAVIDWHILGDGNPNTHIEEAKDFFERTSKQYADYGNVIYEIANEPNGGTTWEDVKRYAEVIIPIIRKNAPDAIIIVGTPTWCQDVDAAAASPITGQTNLMYAVHFYAATHKDDLRAKVEAALDAGLPIFASEFGLCEASGNGNIDYAQSDEWFALLQEHNISYAAWNISNKAETSALFSSACTKTSGYTDEDLSESGKYIKEKIQSSY